MRRMNPAFPIRYPQNLYRNLSGLCRRGLMTPSYLSSLITYAILPAKMMVPKNQPLQNDQKNHCTKDSLRQRSRHVINDDELFDNFYQPILKTHTLEASFDGGVETLTARHKERYVGVRPYVVHFCGNAQDAMTIYTAHSVAKSKKNHIFWNYPGVGGSKDSGSTIEDLIEAGYQQVKRVLNQNVPADKITLSGLSLGGGVAAQVARRLHEEGHLVHLTIDRSFANLRSVVPALLTNHQQYEEHKKMAPLLTSCLAFSLSGIALGTTFAGLIASIGLVSANAIAALGFAIAYLMRAIGFIVQTLVSLLGEIIAFPISLFSRDAGQAIKDFFDDLGESLSYAVNYASSIVHECIATIAWLVETGVNLLSSIIGGGIATMGAVAGTMLGLVVGGFLSLQLVWTDQPVAVPMTPAFGAVLFSSCCEMNSVHAIGKILKEDMKAKHANKPEPQIEVINTMDDNIIWPEASLNTGLGFKPGVIPAVNERQRLFNRITSFWYRFGGHGGVAEELVEQGIGLKFD